MALASGTAATLDFNGDGLISFAVTGEISGVVIASARDIDVTAPNINANDESFNETRNLILNGNTVGGDTGTSPPPESTVDASSFQEGLLNGFILQFFDNALTRC